MKSIKISPQVSIDDACRLVEQGDKIDISQASFSLEEARSWFKRKYAVVDLIRSHALQFEMNTKTIVWYRGVIPVHPLAARGLKRKGQEYLNSLDEAAGREPRYKEMNLLP